MRRKDFLANILLGSFTAISGGGLLSSAVSETKVSELRHSDPKSYYVSPSGDDSNNGLSPSSAWETLAKVSSMTFHPGDSILFEAGGVWNGELSPGGSGSENGLIVIDKYGKGNKPVIHAPGTNKSAAVKLVNQSYWSVNNLEITNKQPKDGKARLFGIRVKSTTSKGISHLQVQNCFVHDVESIEDESDSNFVKLTGGIIFSGPTNNILIQNNHVKDVSVEGIRNSSSIKCSHFIIDHNLIENVYGDGIVFHGVKNGSAITHNVVRNVCYNTSSANYAGVWTYLSDSTLIAYNEVSGITGGGVNDGQPFDADISTNGDVFEYNYTHDNASGFMLFMPSAQNITVRFNISVNDIAEETDKSRLFNYTVTNDNNNKIYNNTFYIEADVSKIFEGGFNGTFSNNIVYSSGTVDKFSESAVSPASIIRNNCFFPFSSSSITSINGPNGRVSGNISVDPGFVNPGFHGTGRNNAASAYRLIPTSPCLQSGIDIPNNGGADFAGNNITNRAYTVIGAVWTINS